MMTSLFLPVLEKALNRYLALDPESSLRLQRLEQKTITIELPALKLCFQLSVHGKKIHLSAGETVTAEIKIRGTPLNLLALALSRDKKQSFFADTVSIEGDAELGQQIINLFDQLEIDWEEHLSQVIGDLPAHEVGRFSKSLFAWGKKAQTSLMQDVREYLHEEKAWFPPAEALEDFFCEIDELRLDVDRLEARVRQL